MGQDRDACAWSVEMLLVGSFGFQWETERSSESFGPFSGVCSVLLLAWERISPKRNKYGPKWSVTHPELVLWRRSSHFTLAGGNGAKGQRRENVIWFPPKTRQKLMPWTVLCLSHWVWFQEKLVEIAVDVNQNWLKVPGKCQKLEKQPSSAEGELNFFCQVTHLHKGLGTVTLSRLMCSDTIKMYLVNTIIHFILLSKTRVRSSQ